MSLSNPQDKTLTGRIIASGLTGPRETTFSEILNTKAHGVYACTLESEFMDRVRTRATQKARDILAEARAEAEAIKSAALEQGLAEGRELARSEVEQRLGEMASGLAALMENITAERHGLWQQSRRDYVSILKLALEKTLNLAIDAKREQILAGLLDQCLERIDEQTGLTLIVNPEDEAMAGELMARAKAARPGLENWRIRTDANLNPGGIVMESQGGRVDNSLEGRFSGVLDVIARFENGGETA